MRFTTDPTYTNDIHGRLLTETAGSDVISHTYDANGNLLTVSNAEGTTTRAYDQLGRVKSKTVSDVGTTTIQHDITAGMTGGYTAEKTTDSEGNITIRIYDKASRLYQVKVGALTTTYDYYPNGNLKKVTYPNSVILEYTYYTDNRLNTLSTKRGTTILEAYNYAYDNNGNLTTKLDIKGTTTYTYDELNRLSTVTEPNGRVTEYEYDAAGNRIGEEITDGSEAVISIYEYNEQNRLMSVDRDGLITAYYYDNNGNLTGTTEERMADAGGAGTSLSLSDDGEGYSLYRYDSRNQMIYAKADGSEVAMAYNGEGLRIRKESTEDGNITVTRYVYEYDKVVLELDGNGNTTAFNVYGNGMLIRRTDSGSTMHYIYNGHGDVTGLTTSSGIVAMQYYYDAFGVVLESVGDVLNSYMYSGYQYDAETSLYYLNARYYDPLTSRMLSADTYLGNIGNPLSLNLYSYCYNNPLIYFDPSGHIPMQATLANGNTVTVDVTNGKTTMPGGGAPPVGTIVHHTNGNDYQVREAGQPGVKVETVQVSTSTGTQVGGVYNGNTMMTNGSRPEDGSIVHLSNGNDYQMNAALGYGTQVTTVPVITNNGDVTIGGLANGTTTMLDGQRPSEGSFVVTPNGNVFLMGKDKGVLFAKGLNGDKKSNKGKKSTSDISGSTVVTPPTPTSDAKNFVLVDPNMWSYWSALNNAFSVSITMNQLNGTKTDVISTAGWSSVAWI